MTPEQRKVIEAARRLSQACHDLDRCVAEFPADPDACCEYWQFWDARLAELDQAIDALPPESSEGGADEAE